MPVHDDRVLFEFLILEGAQAGLSWATILSKRENYRKAFAGFDPREGRAIHRAQEDRALLQDEGIVRNRLKIDVGGDQRQARFSRCRRSSAASTRTSGRFVGGKPRSQSLAQRARTSRRAPRNRTR